MTDKEKHDHWGELASDVGANPPAAGEPDAESPAIVDGSDSDTNAEPSETEGGVAAESPKAEDAAKDAEALPRKVRSHRPKSGWADLAQDFGLPPAEEPADVKEEPAKEETVDEDVESKDDSCLNEKPDDETRDAGAEGPWEDEGDAKHGEEVFDALFDGSEAGSDVTADGSDGANGAEKETSFEDAIAAVSKEIEEEKAEEEQTGRRRKKRRRRPAKKDAGKDDDGGRVSSQSDKGPSADAEEVTVEAGGFGEGLFEEESAEEAKAGRSEPDEDAPRRGRRRRKRGPRRKNEPQKTIVEESLDEAEDALKEEGAEEADGDEPQNGHGDSDHEATQNGRRKRDEEEPEEGQKNISHRGIPTWDEAVESIIATNLDKRSKRSDGSSSRSRGGRGRGGRERSGSQKRSG